MEYQNIANGFIDIVFPENGQLRSRKVVKRSNARNTGKYPSFKMQRMMQWESVHEGNAMRILDASPNVISFGEQPCVIIYELNGMQHRHYPDFLVVKSDGREFLEIKTEVDANQPDIAERTAFLQKALPGYGYNYSVVLAETLSNQPRLDNINRLIKLGRQAISTLAQEQIRQLFKTQSELTWGMIEQQSPKSIRIVSRLILQGKLSIDFNQPISAATLIRSNFNGLI